MLPLGAIRGRAGLLQQDTYGYGMNDFIAPRRGLSGRTSPVSLGGRLGLGGELVNRVGLAPIRLAGTGLGGLALEGLRPLALNSVGNYTGLGGLSGRGRLSPILAGTAPLPYGNALAALPRTAGFSPNTIPALTRGRGRGGIMGGTNLENHYVYPPLEEHFSIPVYVQSVTGRRSNSILNRLGVGNSNEDRYTLTVPYTATILDMFEELTRGRLDYTYPNVFVVTRGGEYCQLEHLLDVSDLWEIDASYLLVEV